MSSESHRFDEGVERGRSGAYSPESWTDGVFESETDRKARQRGFEAGRSARAMAEAMSERASTSHAEHDWSESSSSVPTDPPGFWLSLVSMFLVFVVTQPLSYVSGFLIAAFSKGPRGHPNVTLNNGEFGAIFLVGLILLCVSRLSKTLAEELVFWAVVSAPIVTLVVQISKAVVQYWR